MPIFLKELNRILGNCISTVNISQTIFSSMKAKKTRTVIIAALAMTLAVVSMGAVTQAIAEPNAPDDVEIPESNEEFIEKQRDCIAENPLEYKDKAEDESTYEIEGDSAFNPCHFVENIDNQHFPISKYAGKTLHFAGTANDNGKTIQIVEEWQVLNQTIEIDGVMSTLVIVTEYENGEIIEIATDFYAQGKNGTVYFFGEYSTDYDDNGRIIGHDGSWLVGDDTPLPGIIMPSSPGLGVGFSYMVEDVPGLVHEKSIV